MVGSVVVGAVAVLVGLVTLVGRFVAPKSGMFSKLEPMQKQFGTRLGTAMHVFAYTLVPLVFGILTLWQAYAG